MAGKRVRLRNREDEKKVGRRKRNWKKEKGSSSLGLRTKEAKSGKWFRPGLLRHWGGGRGQFQTCCKLVLEMRGCGVARLGPCEGKAACCGLYKGVMTIDRNAKIYATHRSVRTKYTHTHLYTHK